MADLVLIAASGLAREVLSVLNLSQDARQIFLVDDDPTTWGTSVGGIPVVGGLETVRDYPDSMLLVCAGRGAARRAIVARLGVPHTRYAAVIHPSVELPESCTVGPGSIVLAHVALTADVSVGRHVVLMPNATLTHDDVVEDFATVCAGVSLGGGVHVENGAYLGMNASVREGARVGSDAVLGMGAALVGDLPSRHVWTGVPARPQLQNIAEVP